MRRRVKNAAIDVGRTVRTLLNPIVICRETEREAWAYADAIVAHADERSPKGFQSFDSDAHAWKGRDPKDPYRFIGGNIRRDRQPRAGRRPVRQAQGRLV